VVETKPETQYGLSYQPKECSQCEEFSLPSLLLCRILAFLRTGRYTR